ncbi:MAG: CvpA family protein [Clostridia bacterium]|nr:CvpA family protein [Clostridia bacterium]
MSDIPKKKATIMGKSRLPLCLALTAAFAAVYFYVALPAINLHDPSFYFFFLLCTVVFCVLTLVTGNYQPENNQEALRTVWKQCKWPLMACALLVVVLLVGSLLGSVVFRSDAYTQLLPIETGDFATDVAEISFDKVPMLDKDSAARLGSRKLGELADMVSQFEVAENYSQINWQDTPVRVATLRYGDLFKWFNNMKDGLPAYVRVDMVEQSAEVVRLSEGMKYTTYDHFGRNLYRLLRFRHPTWMFAQPNFEIDEAGEPWWICPRMVKTIGLFGGTDIDGAVLVNAITGESEYYAATDIPDWVDRVYVAELLIQQYNYYGQYQNGFLNSMFGQKGCTVTTEGYNYIALNDDVYVYTGVTSLGGDESNVGFVLINQRTKAAKYYPCAGAEEYSAMDSAQGVVQHLGYEATFPLLMNVDGQPTYFMSLKDNAGLVKMYAMVNVQNYNVVATGNSLPECQNGYSKLLRQEGLSQEAETGIDGVIDEIRTAVIDGNSWYYFRLIGETHFYAVSASQCETAIILDVGDKVTILDAQTEGDIRTAGSIRWN